MKPAERFVMHAGKLMGLSLTEINDVLTRSGLDPVTAGNWRFVKRYTALTNSDPTAVVKLSFGTIPLNQARPKAAATPPAGHRSRFRVVNGGRR